MALLRISTAHKLARLHATLAFIDDGAVAAKIELYDGYAPSDPDASTSANLLGTVALARPAGALSPGDTPAAILQPAGPGMAVLTGIVAWARIITASGAVCGVGACTDMSGSGPFKLKQLQVYLVAL